MNFTQSLQFWVAQQVVEVLSFIAFWGAVLLFLGAIVLLVELLDRPKKEGK